MFWANLAHIASLFLVLHDNYKLFFSLCSDDAVLAAIGPVSSLPQWLVLWSNIRTTPPPAEGCEYLASYRLQTSNSLSLSHKLPGPADYYTGEELVKRRTSSERDKRRTALPLERFGAKCPITHLIQGMSCEEA